MTTLKDKLIKEILSMVLEVDVTITGLHSDGVLYDIDLNRQHVEFMLEHDLPELNTLLVKHDNQNVQGECSGLEGNKKFYERK